MLRACLDWLEARGVLAWRNNSGLARSMTGGRLIHLGMTGSADIIGVLPGTGQALAVECKSRTGRLRDSQKAFAQRWRASGGLYIVARDTVQLEGLLRLHGYALEPVNQPVFAPGHTVVAKSPLRTSAHDSTSL